MDQLEIEKRNLQHVGKLAGLQECKGPSSGLATEKHSLRPVMNWQPKQPSIKTVIYIEVKSRASQ